MIRVRIAPSPTGNLHIGTARTALFNWLFAKKMGGEFILRIEDTDLERSDKKFEEDIITGLKWLGLDWSNSEIYRQSERLDIYAEHIKKLIDSGKAFWCDHSKDELEAEQKEQSARKEAPRHICQHKHEKRTQGQIIRLAVDPKSDKKIVFEDKIRGKIEFEEKLLGDFSLAKDLKTPLYNFAVVIDDADMKISHVIRGEDHISNTPKQILIYEALGEKPPVFAHLPLILGPDRSKMSKRHGATSMDEYKKDYLPEAMVNFMAYLGYTYSKEIMSKEEMAAEFELGKVHKSGAIFDVKKLNWINAQYIRGLPPKEFKKLTNLPNLPDKTVPLITERLERLTDVENFGYLSEEDKNPNYDKDLLLKSRNPISSVVAIESISSTMSIVKEFGTDDKTKLREELDISAKTKFGGDRGVVYWPFRVSATGRAQSPDPVDIANVLGKERVLERLEEAKKKLE